MKLRLMAGIAGLTLIALPAFAQTSTVEERTTVVTRSADPDIPDQVRTYVTTKNVPVVTYGQPVIVGHPVSGQVTWLDVPSYPKYRWAYLDGHRVVIDTATHDVVAVY
jgi:hypothetical protein